MNAITRKKAPWGLFGAVAVAVAVESAVARLDLDLTRPENLDWRQAHRAAARSAPGCDVLCFGTSMAAFGVFPEVVERKSGLRPEHGGLRRPGLVQLFLAAPGARSGAKPRAVLVDFHPWLLAAPYDPATDLSDVVGLRDSADLAWALGDVRFFVSQALTRSFPSIYHRHAIRKGVFAALGGLPVSLRDGNLQALRNHLRNKGAIVSARVPGYRGEVADVYKTILIDRPFHCLPVEERYIRRFLDLADAHGVRVYWLVMPLVPALQHGRGAAGRDAEYLRFVRAFQGHPNLSVIDGRKSAYPHSVFFDACHLDSQGGYVFSSDLAEVLRRGRVGEAGGWFDLPAYRDRPVNVPIENTLESALALERAGARCAGEARPGQRGIGSTRSGRGPIMIKTGVCVWVGRNTRGTCRETEFTGRRALGLARRGRAGRGVRGGRREL